MLLFGIALTFVAGGTPLNDTWSRLGETGHLDFRWPFYYAFRDRLHFSYELLPAWLPILRRLVPDVTMREFLREALEKGDPEFLAVAETATKADVDAFLLYALELVEG